MKRHPPAATWCMAILMLGACLSPGVVTAQETVTILQPRSSFPMLPEAAARLRESFGPWRVQWPDLSPGAAAEFPLQSMISYRAPLPIRVALPPEYAVVSSKTGSARHGDPLHECSRVVPGAAPLIQKIREQMKEHPQFKRMMMLLVPAP